MGFSSPFLPVNLLLYQTEQLGLSASAPQVSPLPLGPLGQKKEDGEGLLLSPAALHVGLLIVKRNCVHRLRFLQIAPYLKLASPEEIGESVRKQ